MDQETNCSIRAVKEWSARKRAFREPRCLPEACSIVARKTSYARDDTSLLRDSHHEGELDLATVATFMECQPLEPTAQSPQ